MWNLPNQFYHLIPRIVNRNRPTVHHKSALLIIAIYLIMRLEFVSSVSEITTWTKTRSFVWQLISYVELMIPIQANACLVMSNTSYNKENVSLFDECYFPISMIYIYWVFKFIVNYDQIGKLYTCMMSDLCKILS